MYYPEISPTAPATRDDLAQAMLLQQQGPDMNEYERAGEYARMNYQGHSPTASDMAVVGGPFGGRGGVQEGFGEGVADPALGSPSFTEPGATPVSGFGRGGDNTSAASQAAQGRDAAAMAAAAQAAQAATAFSNSMPAPGNFGQPGNAMVGFNNPGGFVVAGGANQPGFGVPGSPLTSTHVATPTTPAPNSFNDRWGGFPTAQPQDIFDPNATPVAPQPQTPVPTARPTDIPESTPTYITVQKTSPPAPSPIPTGRAPVGVPGEGPGGGVNSGVSSPGGGGFGGGIDMSATGGYEGSASVGNTTGAAGFTSPGGGSGFGNQGGSVGSYGSYAGSEMNSPGYSSMAPGFEGGGPGAGSGPGGVGTGGNGVGDFGGGTSGAGSAPGGGTDAGASPGGVG